MRLALYHFTSLLRIQQSNIFQLFAKAHVQLMVPCAVKPYSLVKWVLKQTSVPTLPTRIRTSMQFLPPTLGHNPPSVLTISEDGYQCFGGTQVHLPREHEGSMLFRNAGTHLGRFGKDRCDNPKEYNLYYNRPASWLGGQSS